jgi:hypothetical protein
MGVGGGGPVVTSSLLDSLFHHGVELHYDFYIEGEYSGRLS